MNPYLDLYLTFARIGVCTFGGGYAMLPILQREVVEKRHWATEDELMDYYAIGQCTPGVIAVNTSTFIGYKTHGILGGIAATAGMITPSLIIITIIAAFIQQFAHLAVVQHAFAGIRIAVCALVLQSVWKMAKKGVVDVPTSVILLVTFVAVAFFGVSPVVMVVIAAAAGIIIGMIRRKRAWLFYCCFSNFSRPVCSPSAADWRPCPSSSRFRCGIRGSRRTI